MTIPEIGKSNTPPETLSGEAIRWEGKAEEFATIDQARVNRGDGEPADSLNPEFGVAFSGGGVRSATFCLGVIQALASLGLLGRVGYISSVSGGSYINSWLASWIRNCGFAKVNDYLADTADKNDQQSRFNHLSPVSHLRRYSSYLTPQRGFLSSDVWTAIAAYVLRLIPNLLFVGLAAFLLVTIPYFSRDLYRGSAGDDIANDVSNFRESTEDAINSVLARLPTTNPSGMAFPTQDRDAVFGDVVSKSKAMLTAMDDQTRSSKAKPQLAANLACDSLIQSLDDFGSFNLDPSQIDPALLRSMVALRNELSWSIGTSNPPSPTLNAALTKFINLSEFYSPEDLATNSALRLIWSALDSARSRVPNTNSDFVNELGECARFRAESFAQTSNPSYATDGPMDFVSLKEFSCAVESVLPTLENAHALRPATIAELHSAAKNIEKDALTLETVIPHQGKGLFSRWLSKSISILPTLLLALFGVVCLSLPPYPQYDPSNATASRSASSCHALRTSFAMLFLGPALLEIAVRGETSSTAAFGAWFLFLLIVSLAVVLVFVWRIGAWKTVWSTISQGQKDEEKEKNSSQRHSMLLVATGAFFASGFTGAMAFYAVSIVLRRFFVLYDHFELGFALAATFAPLFLLGAYVAMASTGMALLPFKAPVQEWINRIWGDTAILTLGWSLVASISLLWPLILSPLQAHLSRSWAFPGYTVMIGWAMTTVSGIASAYSGKTGGPGAVASDSLPWRIRAKRNGSEYWIMSVLARIAPYIFVVGLLLMVSSAANWLFRQPQLFANSQSHWLQPEFVYLVVALAATLAFGYVIDVNRLSLHNVYRFRLIECYLAASAGIEAPNLTVAELKATESNKFDGPFPIINCTLNVTKSGNLDLQKRRAINFYFSPVNSGYIRYQSQRPGNPSSNRAKSETTGDLIETDRREKGEGGGILPPLSSGLIPTDRCASRGSTALNLGLSNSKSSSSITLGGAMAISGAAQSPNEGSHTSPAVAALLAAANVRLGWWLGNPRNQSTRCEESPQRGLKPMIDELLGRATDESRFIYLSDGGHFENLGLIELVRRGCKLIIVCDADCDPHYHFDDLVNAMELCQIHFGAMIDIHTDPLLTYGPSKYNRSAFTIGSITYADGSKGTILYLKPAVTPSNSVIVRKYDRDSPEFPHEPTVNQWFDETQFEAYRLLGRETAVECLKNYHANRPTATPPAPTWWNQTLEQWTSHVRKVREVLYPSLRRGTDVA